MFSFSNNNGWGENVVATKSIELSPACEHEAWAAPGGKAKLQTLAGECRGQATWPAASREH